MAATTPGGPATSSVPGPQALSRPKLNPGWGLVILGGLLGVLGAFLTWATVDYGGLATHTYRGVSAGRDGKITIVLAVLVLGITAAAFLGWIRGWMRPVLAILGLVIAFIAIADLAASPSVGSEEQARLRVTAQVTSSNGIGEWLTLVAGIVIVVGVVLVGRYARVSAPEVPAIGSSGSTAAAQPLAPGSAEPSAETPAPEQSETSPVGEPRATDAVADAAGAEPVVGDGHASGEAVAETSPSEQALADAPTSGEAVAERSPSEQALADAPTSGEAVPERPGAE